MSVLLKLPAVEKMVGLKKTKIYALIQEGKFPPPVKIGSASSWVDQEIENWIALHASLRTMSTEQASYRTH